MVIRLKLRMTTSSNASLPLKLFDGFVKQSLDGVAPLMIGLARFDH
jgi:hypothetical protein